MQIDLATPRAGQAVSQSEAEVPGPRSSVHLVRGEVVGASDFATSHEDHQAPAVRPEATDVCYTQEAGATPHALPSPMGQETRFKIPPGGNHGSPVGLARPHTVGEGL